MKRKLKGVLGIALTLVLLASLTVGLAGAPAGAASSNLKFTTLELPKVEDWTGEATFAVSEGDYWTTPGIDVGPIAQTPDGDTLFAAAYPDGGGWYEVMKSLDGGYSWKATGLYDEANTVTDTSPVVDIVASPEYADDTTVCVATEDSVFVSDDGGKNFVNIPGIWDGAIITDLDVTITEGGDLAIMVGTSSGVFVTLGTSGGASTATWSTTQKNSGSYSALLNFVDAHTYVDFVPAAGTLVTDFAAATGNEFSFYYYYTAATGGTGPQLELKFEDPLSTNYIDITLMLQGNADEDAWTIANMDTIYGSVGTWVEATSTFTPYVDIAAAIAGMATTYNTWELTKVRVELYNDPSPARTAYIDDVTIAGITYNLEPSDVYVKKGLLNWKAQAIINANVLACAFLPTFVADSDIGMGAVVTTGATTAMTFSFEDTRTGGGWGSSGIVDAPITNASGNPFGSEFARIAFPDDFDAFGIGNNVCFVGIAEVDALGAITLSSDPPDGSDAYKVICKEAGTSTAVDLDVRGVITTLLPTATAVTSIDICGDAENATILVGTDVCNPGDTPSYWFVYKSEDSGSNWQFSFKQPTGGAMTRVLMAPDFCDSGLAYAATVGVGTSAFQRTTDGGDSWNQISLIDYGDGTAGYDIIASTGFNAYGYNANGTLCMITQVSSTDGALWGRIDGKHWERILSYANAGVTDMLDRLDILGDGSAIFATDLGEGLIWRSTDMGATFPKKISTKTPLTTVAPVSATTLYTGSAGEIWWSTRSGTGWTKPDDSEIPASAAIINIGFPGDDIVLVGAISGVFISSNGGETVEKVGVNNPFGGPTIATSDMAFAANGILYTTSPGEAAVMRTVVDLDNPGDAEWIQIDDYQDSTGTTVYSETTFVAGGPAITLPPSGVLYVIDAATVVTTGGDVALVGGLWRSTNATADTDSVVPPYFERENKGLNDNDALGLLSLDLQAPPAFTPTFFCKNSAALYYEQVVMYTDTLNVGVPLASPEADAVGVGLLPEGEVYPEVILLWQEMAGAIRYEVQVAIDADFKTTVEDWFTPSLASPSLTLFPNTTYYWRVRVASEQPTSFSLIGAPLISPWSETFKFKTAIGASMARPALQAPEAGAVDVPLNPTFEWSGIEWADVYEYELALDPATTDGGYFATPLVALTGADSLVSTAWKCDTTLDYEGRYYWHVKAIGVDTSTPWSDVGTFTTMGEAPPPPTQEPPLVIPPAQVITPAWIWAIVIIGAILVIAVVVLIVTTRRVP